MTPRYFPPLDPSDFGGSLVEMGQFTEQRYARMAREAFAERGRGVLVIHLDRAARILRPEYNTAETHDGSAEARRIRALIDGYDPARQAVMVYRDVARWQDVVGIVDIVPQH
jgi:hypothetical protein